VNGIRHLIDRDLQQQNHYPQLSEVNHKLDFLL
jgi:hypothetical protein